ncbi:hypothetical protein QR680_002310 [Steinernema hermaphroditum]|uniref:G-protein coupled receptors family 1 profile domain-containing protein n=1 Tax=Steinernema hermaphroditum TaxID=289476 RepID=A0AA39H278_9BILA|nr:hypothetical protein QR680_002310 [Steinernema hermaphroditum]
MITLAEGDVPLFRGTFIFVIITGLLSFGLNIFIYVLYITSKQCRSRNTFFRTIVISDAFNGLSFLMAGLSRIQVLVLIDEGHQAPSVANSDCILRLFPIVLLIARLWPTLIFFIMGLESYLSVHYPLWFRDARIRKPPAIIFSGFFLLVALTIGYANAMFMSPYEPGFFTCDQNSTFGSNCGWWFDGFVIVANSIGLALTLRSMAVLATPTSETLFGHNTSKLQQQRRTNTSVCAIGVSNCIFLVLPCIAGDLMILSETRYSYRYLIQSFLSFKPLCNLAVMMMSQDKLSEILSSRMLKCLGRQKRKNCVGYTVTYVTSGPLAFNQAIIAATSPNASGDESDSPNAELETSTAQLTLNLQPTSED